MNDARFTMEIGGMKYRGTRDNYIDWMVFLTGEFYEHTYINLIGKICRGGCAVDVGANVGNHTLAFSNLFDEVVAVEPFPPVYQRLELKTGHLNHVQTFNVGFGAGPSEAHFVDPAGRNLGNGRVASSGTTVVELVEGDAFLSGRHKLPIRLIKIDVEGYEHAVLQGLRATIARDRPTVFYETTRRHRTDSCDGLHSGFGCFPKGYTFWGLRGQTSFPTQREIARPVAIGPRESGRRFSYVLACPPGILPPSNPGVP